MEIFNTPIALGATGVIIPARPGERIVITSIAIIADAAVNVYLKSNSIAKWGSATYPTHLTAEGAGFVLNHNEAGWIVGELGKEITLDLSASVGVSGVVNYRLENR